MDNTLFVDDLPMDVLPGGCSEPVIHVRAVVLIFELLRSTPAQ